VYARTVGSRTLTFGVSGMLYRDALVMYDRETESLWSQVHGLATTWVIGFRHCYGNGALQLQPEFETTTEPARTDFSAALAESPRAAAAKAWFSTADELPQLRRTLATESAIRSDAHLVKYVRACLDAADQSPADTRLFYAAAAYLCSIWCREELREQIAQTFTST